VEGRGGRKEGGDVLVEVESKSCQATLDPQATGAANGPCASLNQD
jgi:hypothetical protein